MNAASRQSSNETSALKASSSDETPKSSTDLTDRKRMLCQAAMIIKADINETTDIAIQAPQTADLTIETSKTSVPESLYWLLRLIISSEDTDDEFETTECQSSSDERRILMTGQDIVHIGSRGRVKNPKHMALAIAIHYLTGSKQLIKILNLMGHFA